MKVIKSYEKGRTKLEILELAENLQYCVRKTTKGRFFGKTIEFVDLDKNGTQFFTNRIIIGITSSNDLSLVTYFYNANVAKLG